MAETFEDAPELLFFDTFSHEVNEVNIFYLIIKKPSKTGKQYILIYSHRI